MIKIIFVCYSQGTGGEKLATEISKLDKCNNLKSKTVEQRTITVDILECEGRSGPINYDTIHKILNKVEHSPKWYVVPTHYHPIMLDKINAKKLYVIINNPTDSSHIKMVENNIIEKVLLHKFSNILELKGQIEADGYDPKSILSNMSGIQTYDKLQCLYNSLDTSEENIAKIHITYPPKQKMTYLSNTDYLNAIYIPYKNTLQPNFYQTFTKSLSKSLTI